MTPDERKAWDEIEAAEVEEESEGLGLRPGLPLETPEALSDSDPNTTTEHERDVQKFLDEHEEHEEG